jgi:hypothetical protein
MASPSTSAVYAQLMNAASGGARKNSVVDDADNDLVAVGTNNDFSHVDSFLDAHGGSSCAASGMTQARALELSTSEKIGSGGPPTNVIAYQRVNVGIG